MRKAQIYITKHEKQIKYRKIVGCHPLNGGSLPSRVCVQISLGHGGRVHIDFRGV